MKPDVIWWKAILKAIIWNEKIVQRVNYRGIKCSSFCYFYGELLSEKGYMLIGAEKCTFSISDAPFLSSYKLIIVYMFLVSFNYWETMSDVVNWTDFEVVASHEKSKNDFDSEDMWQYTIRSRVKSPLAFRLK